MPITDCDLVACYDDTKPAGKSPLWFSLIVTALVIVVLVTGLLAVVRLVVDLVARFT